MDIDWTMNSLVTLPDELLNLVKLDNMGYSHVDAAAEATANGTPYLKEPGVALLARSQSSLGGFRPFLEGFSPDLRFPEYLDDPGLLEPGAQLCKAAGQLCYASFGPKRTHNADAGRYFANIRSSGHGSVLEHASFSFLLYGVSRSVTHEVVRHRAGMAYSQISQRYVSGRVLRFVERPEYQNDPELHRQFERRIDRAAADYESVANHLLALQKDGLETLSGDAATDRRKKVQQAARSLLPNETEAPLVMTGNARSLRHFIEMRGNSHAEVEIRRLALRMYLCLSVIEPDLFGDYVVSKEADGLWSVLTDTPKV